MPRPPRVEFEGALDHVITRANNRQVIFRDEEDYHKFLTLLEGENQKHPFSLYASVLRANHVHVLVERQTDPLHHATAADRVCAVLQSEGPQGRSCLSGTVQSDLVSEGRLLGRVGAVDSSEPGASEDGAAAGRLCLEQPSSVSGIGEDGVGG